MYVLILCINMPLTNQDIIEPLDTSLNPLVPKPVPVDLSVNTNPPPGNSSDVDSVFSNIYGKYNSSSLPTTPYISVSQREANNRYPHYNPDINNEEYAAMNQRWYTQLGRSLLKGGATAIGTFINSLLTYPDITRAIKSGDVSKLYQSDTENAIDTWLDYLENKFPNYYTQWEKDHPFLSAITPTGAANFWGENIIKNLGFTVGAIGGAVAQDALLGAVTGGAGALAGAPGVIGRTSLALNKLFTLGADANKVIETLNSAGKTINTLERLKNGAQYTAALFGSARTEAAFEARQGYNTLKNDLIQEYKDSHGGADPDAATLDRIEKSATASANVRFLTNMAILMPSDAIQFDSIFNMFNAERKGLSNALNISVNERVGIKLAEDSLDKFVSDTPKTMRGYILGNPKELLAGVLSEGFYEEGLQNVAQEGTYNYYHNKYYNKNKDTWDDILKSTGYGFSQTFGSTEGWENVVAGALMSMITSPATRIISKAKDTKLTDSVLEALNSEGLTGTFETLYKDAANSAQISQDMRKSVQNGNIFEYKNLKHDAFYSFIKSALNVNRFDVRLDQLNMLKELSDDQFVKLFGMDPTDSNRKTVTQYVDNLINKANEIRNINTTLNSTFQNPYIHHKRIKPDEVDKMAENIKHTQYEEWKDNLGRYISIAADVDNRIQSIKDKWVGTLAALNTDNVANTMTTPGLRGYAEQYKGTPLGNSINEFLGKLKNSNNTTEGNPPLVAEHGQVVRSILSKILGKDIHKALIPGLMNNGADIAALKSRKRAANAIYDALSTDEGREQFIKTDDELREKSEKYSKQENNTIRVKFNEGQRNVKVEKGKKYYLFNSEETPEGVPLQSATPIVADGIDNDNLYYFDATPGRKKLSLNDIRNNHDIYTEEEISKKENGKFYLNHLTQRYKMEQTYTVPLDSNEEATIFTAGDKEKGIKGSNKRTVRGNLHYDPIQDKLYFRYWDGSRYQYAPILSTDQFDLTTKGNNKIEPDGKLVSIEQFKKETAEKIRRQKIDNAREVIAATDIAIKSQQQQAKELDKKLSNLKKSLDKKEARLNKLLTAPVDEKRYISLSSQIKTVENLNKTIRDLKSQINTLNDQRNQLDYNLKYLTDIKEAIGEQQDDNLDSLKADLESKISDLNSLIKERTGYIKRLNNLVKIAQRAYKAAHDIVVNTLKKFSEKFPSFRIEDIKNSIENNTPLDEGIATEVNETIEALTENKSIKEVSSHNIDKLLSHIKEAQTELDTFTKERNALQSQLQGIYDKADAEEAERLKREKIANDQEFQKRAGFESRTKKEDPIVDPSTEFSNEKQSSAKYDEDIYISTSGYRGDDLSPEQIRYNRLTSNLDHLSDRDNIRAILITPTNEDNAGLAGFSQAQWEKNVEFDHNLDGKINDPIEGYIGVVFARKDKKGTLHFIDDKGNNISEVGKPVDINQIVSSSLPAATLYSRRDDGTKYARFQKKSKNVKEDEDRVKPYLDKWVAQRKEIQSSKEVSAYEFDLFGGEAITLTKAEKVENDVVETGLIKQTKNDNSELDDNNVIKVSRGTHIVHNGRNVGVKAGRVVLSYKSNFQYLNNRNLTDEEADLIHKALIVLAKKAYENWTEFKKDKTQRIDILDPKLRRAIAGLVHFGTPQDTSNAARNQIWIDKGFLYLGRGGKDGNILKVPFNEKEIKTNAQNGRNTVRSFLKYVDENGKVEGIYNSVSDSRLQEGLNAPYYEITDVNTETGEITYREWRNYQNFLLSPTYQLQDISDPLNGKPRKEKVPLSVIVQKQTGDSYPYRGKYAVLRGLPEVKSSPAKENNTSTLSDEEADLGGSQTSPTALKGSSPIEIEGINYPIEYNLIPELVATKEHPNGETLYRIEFPNTSEAYKKSVEVMTKKGRTPEEIPARIQRNFEITLGKAGIIDSSKVFGAGEAGNYFKLPQVKESASTEDTLTQTVKGATPTAEQLLSDLLSGTEKSQRKHKTVIPGFVYDTITPEDITAFKAFLKKNLPNFNLETIDHLISKLGEDGKAWGSMEGNLITVFTGAPKGTEYHEAFEAVWNHFVPLTKQVHILREVAKTKGTFFDALTGKEISFSEANAEQLKEHIADQFADYINKVSTPKSFLRRVFDSIIDFFRNIAGVKSELEKLYGRINSGYYREMIPTDTPKAYKAVPNLSVQVNRDISDEVTSLVLDRIFRSGSGLFDPSKLTSTELYNTVRPLLLGTIASQGERVYNNPSLTSEQKHSELLNLRNIKDNIEANWDRIVDANKEFLKTIGVEFADDGDPNRDDRTDKEYDRDHFTIDPIRSASTAIKLLMATITERYEGNKETSTDVFGEPLEKPTSIGGGRLVDFAKVFVITMDNLAGTGTLDEMVSSLTDMAKDDSNIIILFERLGGNIKTGEIPFESLTFDQWRLLVSFYNTFSKQKPTAIIQYERDNGNVYNTPASENDLVKVQVHTWMEQMKAKADESSSIIKFISKGSNYQINGDKINYSPTKARGRKARPNEIKFLSQLGINFPQNVIDTLSIEELNDFDKYVDIIAKALKSGGEVNLISGKSLTLEGAFNNLARLYISTTRVGPRSVFFDENSNFRQKYVPHNRISVLVNKFNNISSLEELSEHLPQVAGDTFSKNSITLSPKGLFFRGGKRQQSLENGYILAHVNSDSGFHWNTTKMSYALRLQTEINQNINGWYYTISSVDSNTEHMIKLGNNIHHTATGYNKVSAQELSIFSGYLVDEINLINEAPSRISDNAELAKATKNDTDRSANKLRFMAEILSPSTQNKVYSYIKKSGDVTPEDFVKTIKEDISKDLKKYFQERANDLKSLLINEGVISEDENIKDRYNWKWLDENGGANALLSLDRINDYLKFLEVNYTIANIEQHKLLLGDPFQRSLKDSIRRVKTFNSPRGTTLVHTQFDNWANREISQGLTKGELGYNAMKPYINTVTVNDIKVQGQPSRYTNPNKAYNVVDVTDGSAMGTLNMFEQSLLKVGQWSPEHMKLKQDDYALARYVGSNKGRYTYIDQSLKAKDKEVYDAFVANGNRHVTNVTLSSMKPIVSGPKYNSTYINNVIDKFSIFPITYALAMDNPDMEELYWRIHNSKQSDENPVDYAIFLSGRKAGADIIDNLYDEDGAINTSPFQSDIRVGYDTFGIITEVNYKEGGKITQISQLNNLAPIDLMENGKATNPDNQPLIDRYHGINKARVNAGFNNMLRKFGIIEQNDGGYTIEDKTQVSKLLQDEIFRRQLPDNVKDAIRTHIDPDTGKTEFELVPEATNSYKAIMSILMSTVRKSFIQPKVNGIAAVQVPVAMFGDKKIRKETINGKSVWVADHLKFYEPTYDEKGNIISVARAEVMISSKHIRKSLPKRLKNLSDKELIKYLNNTKEGKKLLTGVGSRIPTSGLNLAEAFVIKEFLPEIYGDTVVLPAEITKKTSSDFDIDKLNMYLYNTYTDAKGDLKSIEYKGSEEETKEFYGKLFDEKLAKSKKTSDREIGKSNFRLTALQGVIYDLDDRIVDKATNYLEKVLGDDYDVEDVENLADNVMKRLEVLGREKAELDNDDIQNAAREEYVDEKYNKSLDNAYMDTIGEMILLPDNFERLITPNEANELEHLRDELNEILGINSSIPSPISRTQLSRYRDNNLIGKTNVGVYSLSQIYNTIMQGVGTAFNPQKIQSSDYTDEIKEVLDRGPLLEVKKDEDGNVSLSNIQNVKGNYISDYINQCVTGAVDMTKDQFLSELGAVRLRGPIFMAMLREGITPENIVWLLHQPIVMDHIKMLNQKNSGRLISDYNIDLTRKKYATKAPKNGFNAKNLKDNVRKYVKGEKLTPAEKAEQLAIFDEFIFHAVMAEQLFAFNTGINYDRANFGDTGLIYSKSVQTYRAINNNLLTGAERALSQTSLGELKNNLTKTRDALSNILPTELPSIRAFTDDILSEFTKPNQFMSDDDRIKISGRIKSSVIDFLSQTQGSDPLNRYIISLLVDKNTSAADEFMGALRNKKSNFAANILNINTRQPGKTRNITFEKKQIDTLLSNDITEGFRELRDSVLTSDLYQDVVKAAILQSGIDNSPISFTNLLPLEDYKRYIEPLIKNIQAVDFTPLKEAFFRNNWKNSDIVRPVEEHQLYDNVTDEPRDKAPYANVPRNLKLWHSKLDKPGGRLIGISTIFNQADTKYPYLTITNNKPQYSKKQRDAMRKKGDYSYKQVTLYKQVSNNDGEPFHVPGTKEGEEIYIYKPVNAWGDGYYAKEYYTDPQQPVLDNGTVKINTELQDADIIAAYQGKNEEVIEASSNTIPAFKEDNTEGTDESCTS